MPATDRVHSPTPEELMAYIDGESPADARAVLDAHVAACAECRQVISDLARVNRAMAAWQPETAPPMLRVPTVPSIPRILRLRNLGPFSWRPAYLTLSVAGLAVTALLVGTLATSEKRVPYAAVAQRLRVDKVSAVNGLPAPASRQVRRAQATQEPPAEQKAVVRPPSVIRTATLRLVASDFNAARANVESIVAQAGGFLDQITVNGAPGAARTLAGSLRVPAARLGDALTRLRQLGQVTEDTQGAEDVTDQLVDLETRLANARAEEQRLNAILKKRTGKLSDVLEVEREISRVRLEIEQMDAQRVNTGRRVSYATITLQIDEVRKAGLESGPLSLSTRLRIAAADGVEAAIETLVGAVLFALRAGPALLIWIGAAGVAWALGRRIVRLKAEAARTRT